MADITNLDPDGDNISWIAYYDISDFVSESEYDSEDLNNPSRFPVSPRNSNEIKLKEPESSKYDIV